MRARVPGLLLALTFCSPAFAEGVASWRISEAGGEVTIHRGNADVPAATTGGAPRLSYTRADAPDPDAPKLAYALVDPFIVAPPEVAAVSAPTLLPALDGGMRAGSEGTQLLAAIRSEEPAEQKLAGLVTIAALGPGRDIAPAPIPGAAPPAPPRATPLPAGADGDANAPAAEPDGRPPRCAVRPVCP